MTLRTALFFRAFYRPAAIALVALLSACGQPTTPIDQSTAPQAQNIAEQVDWLLTDARRSQSPKREQLQLAAVRLLLEEEQLDLAESLLTQFDSEQLSRDNFIQWTELECRLLLARGRFDAALAMLESARIIDESSLMDVEQQLVFNQLRAQVLARLGKHLASAQQRIYSDPLLTPEQQRSNRQALWQSLMLTPSEEIAQYLPTAFSRDYQGWLALALIAKKSDGDLNKQVEKLDQWQLDWASHPANNSLPEDLVLIRELANNQPQHIALMLPMSGPLAAFGHSIRDGFMAAYYRAKNNGSQVPQLSFFDTASSDDFISQYQQAELSGAELIIGPLERHRVRLLFDHPMTIPTLALNRVDDYGNSPELLVQFGLAPEDEARQIAAIARRENRQHAMVIAPEGEWGDRVLGSFESAWQAQQGQLAAISRFNGQQDYSKRIKEALLLQHSEARAKRVQQTIGQRIEFLPRRRQDVDMVFLLAKPQQARSIKPLLDFHYASDLPIYATSRIYGGYENPRRDRDINGIKFTDMPWVLKPDSDLKELLNSEIRDSKSFQHMYALGVDSFQLAPRLKQLIHIPSSHVYGQTGALSLNGKHQIERSMLLAQMQNGKPTAIAIAGD
jgi:hypothetical protein